MDIAMFLSIALVICVIALIAVVVADLFISNDPDKEKRKNDDIWAEKLKNDELFIDRYGNEYEIIEDDVSGSIKPVYESEVVSVFDKYTNQYEPVFWNYHAFKNLKDGTVLVEVPLNVQDWEGFPRGAYINNTKYVGDIVKLIDGCFVQVEEVLGDGKYRMRIIPNFDDTGKYNVFNGDISNQGKSNRNKGDC